jgi:hypothetical protein
MENEVLAPGQIELTAESTVEAFRVEDAELCVLNGYTPEDVLQFVKESGSQTVNAAIGGMKTATTQAVEEIIEHEVTAKDVENNPELADAGIKEGDVVGIPVVDEKLPEDAPAAE